MCSFLVTNKKDVSLDATAIRKMQQRGPDGTTVNYSNNIFLTHSLLHITGNKVFQPIRDDNTILVFNGEIYNYDKTFSSDGPFLIKNFKNLKTLNGEYAGVFLSHNNAFIFSDLFGTKPIFYSYENGEYAISTFYDVVKQLGFNKIIKFKNNSILDLQNNFEIDIYSLNLNQNEEDYSKWETHFLESVYNRYKREKTFLCISSGYDSGALSLACKILDLKVKFYSISNNENKLILDDRRKFLGEIDFLEVNKFNINKHLNLVKAFGDGFTFDDYDYKTDMASVGLSVILEKAKRDGFNVLISGAGADEIMSDYGIEGRDIFGNSSIKGIFPDDLNSVFPWENFFSGKQQRYLYKEECVSGIHGIESRYPFLDKNLVQSFLNLKPSLKNITYKAPLEYLFNKYNFPFEKGIKRGFKIE